MRDYTLREFHQNNVRVSSLIATYQVLQVGRKGGRRTAQSADTLRAAIVFIHSALEEVFRNILRWKLPRGDMASLNTIPLIGSTDKSCKFQLGDLIPHESRFVNNVILDSIDAYVDRTNINNIADLRAKLALIKVDSSQFDGYYSMLAGCMARRHLIVHQMDRNHATEPGSARVKTVSVRQVLSWQENAKRFVIELVDTVDAL